MIQKTKSGYVLLSKDGSKHLGGPYRTHAEAARRERQVEYFKHAGGKRTPASDLTAAEGTGKKPKPKRPTERQTEAAQAERRARDLAAADDAREAIRREDPIRIERARDALRRGR